MLLTNSIFSCLYYSDSHLAGLWFHFCHLPYSIFNITTRLIILKLKPDYNTLLLKCSNDSHFQWEFTTKYLCNCMQSRFWPHFHLSHSYFSALEAFPCCFKYSLLRHFALIVLLPRIFFLQTVWLIALPPSNVAQLLLSLCDILTVLSFSLFLISIYILYFLYGSKQLLTYCVIIFWFWFIVYCMSPPSIM